MVPFTVPDKPQCVKDNGGITPPGKALCFGEPPPQRALEAGEEDWGDGVGGVGMDLLPGCSVLDEGWG